MATKPGPVWMRLKNRSTAPALARTVRQGLATDLAALRDLNRAAGDEYEPGAANAGQLAYLVELAEQIAAGLDEIGARSE